MTLEEQKINELLCDNACEMLLVLVNRYSISLKIAATGSFTIKWDDGSSEEFTGDGTYSKYTHEYVNRNFVVVDTFRSRFKD